MVTCCPLGRVDLKRERSAAGINDAPRDKKKPCRTRRKIEAGLWLVGFGWALQDASTEILSSPPRFAGILSAFPGLFSAVPFCLLCASPVPGLSTLTLPLPTLVSSAFISSPLAVLRVTFLSEPHRGCSRSQLHSLRSRRCRSSAGP